jgi:ribonucleoside-diphosphate reductase alpha chain
MDVGKKLLSDVVAYTSYCRYLPKEKRRETWEEAVGRYILMMGNKYGKYTNVAKKLDEAWSAIYNKEVLPSMRALQFGGKPMEIMPNRGYNCSYAPVDSIYAFSETMFLLLGGTGVGYSVQVHHVRQLPRIQKADKERRFVIGDSIEGWADAVKILMKGYFGLSKTRPRFDFSDIRPKGSLLKTSGGRAPGADPLRDCLHNIEKILRAKEDGSSLSTLEAHDIMCHVADAVLSGGIRRAALIALFTFEDDTMLECKSGRWWELNPQRGRANNSAVLLRGRHGRDALEYIKERNIINGYGEPGVFWTNDLEVGTNPCAEISLKPFQFCNLTNVNLDGVRSQTELNRRAKIAAFIGTLQAGFTDFHYLRPIWQQTTEEESLIGVGLTGLASIGDSLNLQEAASIVTQENTYISESIGITQAKRCTCVKPDGNTGALLGVSSGIHPWHSQFFIRTKRVNKIEPVYQYMIEHFPELVEDDLERPSTQAILKFPIRAPKGSILRGEESAIGLLTRLKAVYNTWIKGGHREGSNTHNVSVTVTVKPDEWDEVFKWMWRNRDCYSAIALMPEEIKYKQAVFTECTEYEYRKLSKFIDKEIDLSKIIEDFDTTDMKKQIACAGGGCEE